MGTRPVTIRTFDLGMDKVPGAGAGIANPTPRWACAGSATA